MPAMRAIGDAGAVLSVESLGFHHELALVLSRNRKEKKLAVCENAINVEEQKFDFFGAGLGR